MVSALTGNLQIERLFWARPLPVAVLAALAVTVVAWSVFLYRRPSGLRLWQRLGLALTRIVVLLIAVATLLEPAAVLRQTRTYPRRLPILLDVSASMSIRDQRKQPGDIAEAAVALGMLPASTETADGQALLDLTPDQRRKIAAASRLDLAKGLLTGVARAPLASLAQTMDVRIHTFGAAPALVGDGEAPTPELFTSVQPEATQSAIADTLEAIAKSDRGSAPAGIVLLTDGIENSASRRTDTILQELGTRGVPVYPVPVGLPDPDDVSINNVVMQDVAFSGDRVPVRVQIKSRGYEKRTARLSVLLNDRRVSQQTVRLKGGLQFEDIDFRVDVYEKGTVRVDVTLAPCDDEVSEANNRVQRSIRVVNEKVNVLYIEGSARWEFRYLQAILKRDPRIEATFIASSLGPEMARNSPEYIERFPSRRDEAFVFDLVILGDVDPQFFRDEELTLLEELIRERGASLLVLCGPEYTPTAYGGTVVESILPVRFDPEGEWEKVAGSIYPVLTPEGVSSMVMTLENDPEANERIWSRTAPLDHVPPLLSPKPGATLLVGLSDTGARAEPYPLVAWQRYGTGKCMSIGTDRLWRLRFKTGDKYHWRVWSQCIQFMTLSRLLGEHKPIRLETDRSIYAVGDQVRLYAQVLDEDFQPVQMPRFDVDVTGLGESSVRARIGLRPVRAKPGMYEGYFSPPAAGRYRLESNADDRRLSNSIEFQVAAVERELQKTGMRADYLQRIADLSEGRLLRMSQLANLPERVDRDPVVTTVRLERPLWDNWLIVLLVVGLAGMEWLVRRRHDLP